MRHLRPPSASERRLMRYRAEPVTGAWHQTSPAATFPRSSYLSVWGREVSGHTDNSTAVTRRLIKKVQHMTWTMSFCLPFYCEALCGVCYGNVLIWLYLPAAGDHEETPAAMQFNSSFYWDVLGWKAGLLAHNYKFNFLQSNSSLNILVINQNYRPAVNSFKWGP